MLFYLSFVFNQRHCFTLMCIWTNIYVGLRCSLLFETILYRLLKKSFWHHIYIFDVTAHNWCVLYVRFCFYREPRPSQYHLFWNSTTKNICTTSTSQFIQLGILSVQRMLRKYCQENELHLFLDDIISVFVNQHFFSTGVHLFFKV